MSNTICMRAVTAARVHRRRGLMMKRELRAASDVPRAAHHAFSNVPDDTCCRFVASTFRGTARECADVVEPYRAAVAQSHDDEMAMPQGAASVRVSMVMSRTEK